MCAMTLASRCCRAGELTYAIPPSPSRVSHSPTLILTIILTRHRVVQLARSHDLPQMEDRAMCVCELASRHERLRNATLWYGPKPPA